ncbi:MAG: single-stranded DNA-binding protein [Aquiluna sp.]|nr:single-stranded DNA-binding protein [Aquiluna sp.]MCF8545237.1 single-stranded DNA-binding protein [Aquiluna sp.]
MSDQLSVSGLVATSPRNVITKDGLSVTSFRLASTQRRFDRETNSWIDAETNWFTVSAFRQLASNTALSINKGDRIVVNGRIKVRDWDNGERTGTTIEIEAESLGHDLTFGTSVFERVISKPIVEIDDDEEEFEESDAELQPA